MTYALSRNKRSSKWQFRKRYPSDVARILPGEFIKSTGEEDKKAAQARVPMIAAEYERRIAEARAKLAEAPPTTLSDAQALAMAAHFYHSALPSYLVTRPIGQLEQRQLLQDTRERLEATREALGRNEFGMVAAAARTAARGAGVELPEDSPAMDMLRRCLMMAFVELMRAAVARLEGAPDYMPQGLPLDAPAVPAPTAAAPKRTVEALLAAYEADKAAGWSKASADAFGPVSRVLREIFADREVGTITREEAKGLVKVLEGLPVSFGRRKELAGLTVPQMVERGRALGLPVLAPKTINSKYLVNVAAVFNWAVTEQWIASSPFKSLSVYDPVDAADKRDPFKVPQLNKLFRSGPWQFPWAEDGRSSGDYWVPLLCLFHGLRNGEAAGLRVEDVGEESGFGVLHVRPYGGRTLKTKDARATLPIHPELIRLGFLSFVAAQREAGAVQLFPDSDVGGKREVGGKIGARFSRHVQSLGLEGKRLGMHSFRHSFEDATREAELAPRTALALSRRTETGSGKSYGDGMSTRQKAEALGRVAYPGLDLSHLYRK